MEESAAFIIPDIFPTVPPVNYTILHPPHPQQHDNNISAIFQPLCQFNETLDTDNGTGVMSQVRCNMTYVYQEPSFEDLYYYYLFTYIAPVLLGSITLIGMLGNSLVMYVILSGKVMCSVTNILLLNLAVTDMAVLLICVPFRAHKYVAVKWTFGDAMCKFVQYLAYVTTYVTIWSLVAVSVFRFLTVVYSKKTVRIRTKRNIVVLVLLIWAVSLVINIPSLMAYVMKTVGSYTYCGMHEGATEGVFVTFFVMAYALPLVLITIMYILIMLHLHKARNSITSSQIRTQNRTIKVCKVIITVVLAFSLSWLPFHINILVGLYGRLPQGAYYEAFRILWDCMAYGNSCINPIIYNYVSSDFRKAFKDVIYCMRLRNKKLAGVSSQDRTSEMTQMLETAL